MLPILASMNIAIHHINADCFEIQSILNDAIESKIISSREAKNISKRCFKLEERRKNKLKKKNKTG